MPLENTEMQQFWGEKKNINQIPTLAIKSLTLAST